MTAELLTTADVAERLKISPETVAIYASKGEFPDHSKSVSGGGYLKTQSTTIYALNAASNTPILHLTLSPQGVHAHEIAERHPENENSLHNHRRWVNRRWRESRRLVTVR